MTLLEVYFSAKYLYMFSTEYMIITHTFFTLDRFEQARIHLGGFHHHSSPVDDRLNAEVRGAFK